MRIPLETVQRMVETSFMLDTCEIYTFTRGPMNETTGQYTETKSVLYRGKCMFWGPRSATENDEFYTFAVPLSVAPVPLHAMIKLTKCSFDKKKNGRLFEVLDCTMDTYDVYRTISVALRAEPRP